MLGLAVILSDDEQYVKRSHEGHTKTDIKSKLKTSILTVQELIDLGIWTVGQRSVGEFYGAIITASDLAVDTVEYQGQRYAGCVIGVIIEPSCQIW